MLNKFNMELKEREWLGIVGENGSGKSTLSKIILGLEKADRGKIFLRKEIKTHF
ncbi:ATP-binding cassette domain-containing protein [Streptococcus ictaluri]|nr:ATP-binding cassette domain-containing protein [Streptococcus ictaluri]